MQNLSIVIIILCILVYIGYYIEQYKDFTYDINDPEILHKFESLYIQRLNGGNIPLQTVFNSVTRIGNNSGVVLYRNGPLQVQLWLADPESKISEHTHPNVDSYEVYFGGQMYFKKDGKLILSESDIYELPDRKSSVLFSNVFIHTDTQHSGYSGKIGGAFLSIQHWKNGILPSTIDNDWSGDLLDEAHLITSS